MLQSIYPASIRIWAKALITDSVPSRNTVVYDSYFEYITFWAPRKVLKKLGCGPLFQCPYTARHFGLYPSY